MAPLLGERIRLANLSAIEDHPLPVWVDRIDQPGTVAVSTLYMETLGVTTEARSWTDHVLTPGCAQEYEDWRSLGQSGSHWYHDLDWQRPDTGEILHLRAHAWWVDHRTIQGEITDAMPQMPTGHMPARRQYLLSRLTWLAIGFAAGWLSNGGWQ